MCYLGFIITSFFVYSNSWCSFQCNFSSDILRRFVNASNNIYWLNLQIMACSKQIQWNLIVLYTSWCVWDSFCKKRAFVSCSVNFRWILLEILWCFLTFLSSRWTKSTFLVCNISSVFFRWKIPLDSIQR